MSSSACEVVSTTTGIRRRSASFLISASTSRPSRRGRLRSSRTRSGRRRVGVLALPAQVRQRLRRRRRRRSAGCGPCAPRTPPASSARRRVVLDEQDLDRLGQRCSRGAVHASALPRAGMAWGFERQRGRVNRSSVPAPRRVDPDPAAVVLDDLLADGEADAGARVGVAQRAAAGRSRRPCRRTRARCRCRCPRTLISHSRRRRRLGALTCTAGAVRAAELERVADQVLQQRRQQRSLARRPSAAVVR